MKSKMAGADRISPAIRTIVNHIITINPTIREHNPAIISLIPGQSPSVRAAPIESQPSASTSWSPPSATCPAADPADPEGCGSSGLLISCQVGRSESPWFSAACPDPLARRLLLSSTCATSAGGPQSLSLSLPFSLSTGYLLLLVSPRTSWR